MGGSADRIRAVVFEALEGQHRTRPLASFLAWLLASVIGLNILTFLMGTVPSLAQRHAPLFSMFFAISAPVFIVEYLLRVWVCTSHESGLYREQLRGRLRYLLTPLALLDLLVVLSFCLFPFWGLDLRFLRLPRLLSTIGVTRYLPDMSILEQVLRRERRTLASVLVVMFVLLFIASCLVWIFEHQRQPDQFGSVPRAMWWGIVTLTTVGYGDVVPISPFGRVLGVVIMLLGIATFALPAGILASAFSEEKKRRDFIKTWNLVAQVPAFSSLTASDIGSIAALLHPRVALAKEVIFRKGDTADSMFFIVSGQVEVELTPNAVKLESGDFFGEVALLFQRRRTASVVALSYVELLELDAKDLLQLFDQEPEVRQRVMQEGERRLAGEPSENQEDSASPPIDSVPRR